MKVSIVRVKLEICIPVDLVDMEDYANVVRHVDALKKHALGLGPTEATAKLGQIDDDVLAAWNKLDQRVAGISTGEERKDPEELDNPEGAGA